MKGIEIRAAGGLSYFIKLSPGLGYESPFEAAISVTVHFATISAGAVYYEKYLFYTPQHAQYFVKEFSKTDAKKVFKRMFLKQL